MRPSHTLYTGAAATCITSTCPTALSARSQTSTMVLWASTIARCARVLRSVLGVLVCLRACIDGGCSTMPCVRCRNWLAAKHSNKVHRPDPHHAPPLCVPVPAHSCRPTHKQTHPSQQVPCPGGWSHGKADRGGDSAWPNRGLKQIAASSVAAPQDNTKTSTA